MPISIQRQPPPCPSDTSLRQSSEQPSLETTTTTLSSKPARVNPIDWIAPAIRIHVAAARVADGFAREEPAPGRRVVSCPQVIEAGLKVMLLAGVEKRVIQGCGAAGLAGFAVVAVVLGGGRVAVGVGQHQDGALSVAQIPVPLAAGLDALASVLPFTGFEASRARVNS